MTGFKSREVGRFTGTPLLKAIIDYIQKAAKQPSPLKYVLFSAHDADQVSLLSAMGAPLDEAPRYASDINFSLFQDEKNQYYVKVSFNGQPVSIPSCGGSQCSLAKFAQIVRE